MKRKRLSARQLEQIRELIDHFEYPGRLEALVERVRHEMAAVADTLRLNEFRAQAEMLERSIAEIDSILGQEKGAE